ncbi:hypothetical protein IFM89_024705 [Coptis chinensis]|uniref:Myb/SANT-like domain-containing protein n=1 Tax=Coptis chinensis TaxID=261450 RepID=A0A835M6I2_9MAGN|nr:hypothetical protein IFM89_024705 [Coptis chinensis]
MILPTIMARRAGNSSEGKGVVSEGRKSYNGWKPETLKEVAKAVNQRLNMSIGNENVRSRLKTMKKDYLAAKAVVEASGFGFSYNQQTKGIDVDHVAWEEYCKAHPTARPLRKKMFPHFEEACIVFRSDVATGEGGNARHDDEDRKQWESAHYYPSFSEALKRSRLGLEAMPPPPDFKELTEAVRQLTSAFNPVEPTTLLVDALEALPNMEPDLMLRAFDLLGENEQLLKLFWGSIILSLSMHGL